MSKTKILKCPKCGRECCTFIMLFNQKMDVSKQICPKCKCKLQTKELKL